MGGNELPDMCTSGLTSDSSVNQLAWFMILARGLRVYDIEQVSTIFTP